MRRTASSLVLLACLAGIVEARPTLSNKEFTDLKKDAQRAAAAGSNDEVASKLRDMARDDSERAIEFIAELAVRIPDMSVYEAARDAIAGMQSVEATDGLNALVAKERNPMVKILLVDAIGARTDERSAAGIAAALGDRTDEVLRAAVAAAKKRKLVTAVDALIGIVERLEGTREEESLLMTQVRECLLSITGEQFRKAADWRNYWEPRKASFRPITGEPPKEQHSTSERARPTFFGSEIKSNRLAFVIDTSGSMEAADPAQNGDPAPGSRVRMERAKQQLTAVIDLLPEDTRFTIISYSGALFQGGGPGGQLPPGTPEDGPLPPTLGGIEWLKVFKPRIIQANARGKAEAKDWVSKLQANGATFTYNALRTAFEVEGIDTIILLSDGVPTELDRKANAPMTTEKILEEIQGLNRFRRLRIDTFGFDAGGGGGAGPGHGGSRGGPRGGGGAGSLGQFMQDLATQNGGTYTQIQ
jgi:hypothetical protein